MKIIEILPELDIGGVERHVIDLSNELAERGHSVLVVSAGGKMQCQLSGKVEHRALPVQKKSLFTGYSCVRRISKWIRTEGWQIVHAHSRVPAFIAWWASHKTGIPWVYTAHACYSLNAGIVPLKHADALICVSETVRNHLQGYIPPNSTVITNAMPVPKVKWQHKPSEVVRFLFVGRLTPIKGLQTVIEALALLPDSNWTLDVLGDGPLLESLKELSVQYSLDDKINFHGYSDEVDNYMLNSSCLLFPSLNEGYGLVLARAAQIGLPAIASNIESVTAMAGSSKGLVTPGDVMAWRDAIAEFMETNTPKIAILSSTISGIRKMVDDIEIIYQQSLPIMESHYGEK